MILALEKYGTKSFAEVAAPAIEYADQGFPMPEEFGGMLGSRSYESIMALWPDSMKFFYPQGAATPVGEIFREPMLAKTYRELAEAEKKAKGKRDKKLQAVRDLFYKGSIAKRIAEASEKDGGLISYEDLANFHADAEQPKMGTYRGYEVDKPGFWTQGPVMLEALNILEGFDLKSMGHNSRRVSAHSGGSGEARLRRSRPLLWRSQIQQNSGRDSAIERICGRSPQADRSRTCFHGTVLENRHASDRQCLAATWLSR